MTRSRNIIFAAMVACGLILGPSLATAQEFPNKTIRIVVGFAPGGGGDITTRIVAQKMSEIFGSPVIVENRPGAQSSIASEMVAHAEPDGYTLLSTTTTFAVNAATDPNLPFDSINDFVPISLLIRNPNALLVHADFPADTLQELIDYAKENPGQLNIGHSGGIQEYFGSEFARQAGIEVTQIPYSGTGDMNTALLSREIDVRFGTTTSSVEFVNAGQLKGLVIASDQRSDVMPDVPTAAEAGLPDFIIDTWYGVLAPKGTPDEIIQALNEVIVEALDSPDVAATLKTNGANIVGSSPEEFSDVISSEIERFRAALTN